jgi:hypothetical protein
MRNRIAYIFYAVLFLTQGLYSEPSFAQITVGLDNGTQQLISQLPDQVSKALLKTLADALPLIDKSVTSYLQQVNKILSDNISNGVTAVQCAEVGSVKIIQTELGTSLANILFTGRRAGLNEKTIGDYTQSLSDSITNTRDNITVDTEATQVLVAYSDLLIRAAIVKCAANINSALLQNEPDAQIKRISVPSLEWNILIGDRDKPYCRKIHDCIVERRNDLQRYLEAADPQDLNATKATELLKTVPATPELTYSTIPFIHPKIQILDYEQILLSLRDIQRAVEAAKATRQDRANRLWDQAKQARDAALTYVRNNQDNYSHPSDPQADSLNTVNRFPEMVRLSKMAMDLATETAQEDSVHKADADELIKAMNANIQHAENLKTAASATLAKIERDKFEAMQNQRMERSMVR